LRLGQIELLHLGLARLHESSALGLSRQAQVDATAVLA
jgi:hypothetical protein